MKNKNFLKLLAAILTVAAAATLGSLLTASSIPTWYATLPKPSFNPPAWIFAPVWTALFFLMAISAWLVWKKGLKKRNVRIALFVFLGQLVLNVLWSALFFGLHSPAAAFLEISILWMAIIMTIALFARISKTAAWLLAPYLLWVTFAAVLNFAIWNISFRIANGTLLYLPANSSVRVMAPFPTNENIK